MVFDLSGNVVASSQQELPQLYPQPGWVEQDPLQILSTVTQCMQDAAQTMTENNLSVADIKSIGITNQRETTVVWDKVTGEPLHNAIVWLDTRTQSLVDEFLSASNKDELQLLCGLPISTYFSALKLKWLLKNIPEVQKAADENRLQFGNSKRLIKRHS
jgi:glycerol kinase